MMRLSRSVMCVVTLGTLTSVAAACNSADISTVNVQGDSKSISANMGQEISVTLQTIGPGEFVSPPELSTSVIEFDSVTPGVVAVPAGATQVFHFRAVSKGQSVVVFRNNMNGKVVQDTITVQ